MQDLKLALVQTPLIWEDKSKNLEMFTEKLEPIQDVDIIVLPEMFNSGFTMNATHVAEKMDGDTVRWMKAKSKAQKSSIVGSVVIEEDGRFYNRMLYVQSDGEITYYDKQYLFSLAKENEHYTPGQKQVIVEEKGWKIMLQVCYDLRFNTSFQNHLTDKGEPLYDILLNVANWPAKRAEHWKALLKARAIENQSYVIGLNRVGMDEKGLAYSGDSMLVNALGETETQIEAGKATIEEVTLQYNNLTDVREKLSFLKDVK